MNNITPTGIMEKKHCFRKIYKVPEECDFSGVITEHMVVLPTKATFVSKDYAINSLNLLRQSHKEMVLSVQRCFSDKLSPVINEFPCFGRIHPSDASMFRKLFNIDHYSLALGQVSNARNLFSDIANEFTRRIMDKDDCDSLEKCKRLKVSALACMYTVAVRCLDSLDYLEEVRLVMIRVTERNLEAAIAACSSDPIILAEQDCPLPSTFDVHNIDSFADPDVFLWLDGYELYFGVRIVEDNQLNSAEHYQDFAEHSQDSAEHYQVLDFEED